jgi:signal transduction histidine kinase
MAGRSVRLRATVVATLLCAVVLVAGGILLVRTLDHQLTSTRDDLSRSRVHDLLDQAAAGGLAPVLRNVTDDSVAQVLGEDGQVIAASANIQGRPAIVAVPGSPSGQARTIQAPDDSETETYRVWIQSGTTATGRVTVVEGSSLESVREATSTLRRALALGVPLAVLVLALVTWAVLGRALGRLDRIRAQVDAIGPQQLDRRIAHDGRADEVGRLAATMNRMLDRVETSAQRQRQLVADVSHDLQGPLAAQRLSLDLALASPSVNIDLLRTEVLGATSEMEHLVGDLLVLAAVDEGVSVPTAAVDLDAIVLEEAARARTGGSKAVDTSRVSAGPVRANAADLHRIVRNLLDNAVTHAQSRVDLRVGVTDGWVCLDVADDGPGVPDAERDKVFERFHRGDTARTRGSTGTGLGLAIAQSLAGRAGGRIEIVPAPTGANFRLTLPVLGPSSL